MTPAWTEGRRGQERGTWAVGASWGREAPQWEGWQGPKEASGERLSSWGHREYRTQRGQGATEVMQRRQALLSRPPTALGL